MVQAWLKSQNDKVIEDSKVMSGDLLKDVERVGVLLWKFDDPDTEHNLKNFSQRFDITLTDSVSTNIPLGDLTQEQYEAELARYVRPHFHFTDEARHIIDGRCYIDIEIADEKWVRLHLSGGDVIVIPAGVFHCVSLDEQKFVKARGFFRSRGLGDEYVPRYEYDVRSLIHDNPRRQTQSVSTCT